MRNITGDLKAYSGSVTDNICCYIEDGIIINENKRKPSYQTYEGLG
jgi:hypothetical protein